VGVIVSAGLYVFYERWLVRYRAERAQHAASWRAPGTERRSSPLRFLLILFVAGPVFFFGIRYLQTRYDARHPAAEEHRAALLELAAARLTCGQDALTIHREEDPRRARVEGCGQSVTFRWSSRRVRAHPQTYGGQQWYEIDPSCRVDYMGCAMPCE